MAYDPINVGAAGNDHTGDPIRDAYIKTNAMFAALYDLLPWPWTLEALEDLDAGDPVHLVVDSTILKMEKADAADTTKPADGFVAEAVALGNAGGFFSLGVPLNQPDSPPPFTEGSRYFVAVGGGLTVTRPSTALQGQQEIGIALSDTVLMTYRAPMNEAP